MAHRPWSPLFLVPHWILRMLSRHAPTHSHMLPLPDQAQDQAAAIRLYLPLLKPQVKRSPVFIMIPAINSAATVKVPSIYFPWWHDIPVDCYWSHLPHHESHLSIHPWLIVSLNIVNQLAHICNGKYTIVFSCFTGCLFVCYSLPTIRNLILSSKVCDYICMCRNCPFIHVI